MVPALDGLPVQIGLEPIVAAAVPILGPYIAVTFGLYMVALCMLFGIGYALVARMVRVNGDMPLYLFFLYISCWKILNLILDTAAGLVPVVGPVIDVSFKANLANLALLESHLRHSRWSWVTIPPPTRWFQWRRQGAPRLL